MKTITVRDWFSGGAWVFRGRPQDVYRKLRGWARWGMRFGRCAGLWHTEGKIYEIHHVATGYEPRRVW